MSQQTANRRPVNGNANLDARRKAMRRKKIMRRKFLLLGIMLVALIAIILGIVGIVKLITGRFADETTMKITKDGVITMDEVSDFSGSNYDEDELIKATKELATEYNESGKGGKVSYEKAKVKDKIAYLRMEYSDYNAYKNFTGNELFVGTVGEAKAAGYNFEDTFSEVSDKKKGDAISPEDMRSDDSKKVILVRGNWKVVAPGKITAVSDSCTTIEDKDAISIKQPDGNEDATVLTTIMYE